MSVTQKYPLHQFTTGYGLHPKTSLVSIQPHSSAHSGGCSTQCPTLPSRPGFRSFTWQGLETSSWSSSCSMDRLTPHWHWICPSQLLEAIHSAGPWWRNATFQAGYTMTTTTAAALLVVILITIRKNNLKNFISNRHPLMTTNNPLHGLKAEMARRHVQIQISITNIKRRKLSTAETKVTIMAIK